MTAGSVNGGLVSLTVNSSGQMTASATAPGSSASTTFAGLASGVSSTARFANLSVMANCTSGSGVLLAGFVINGAPKQMLLRGIGPGLTSFGVNGALSDPQLSLYQSGTLLQTNSGWGGTATLRNAFSAVGAFSLDPTSNDSAILTTLPGGAYTARFPARITPAA